MLRNPAQPCHSDYRQHTMATGGFPERNPSVPSLPAAMGVFQVAVPVLLQASSLPEAAVRNQTTQKVPGVLSQLLLFLGRGVRAAMRFSGWVSLRPSGQRCQTQTPSCSK